MAPASAGANAISGQAAQIVESAPGSLICRFVCDQVGMSLPVVFAALIMLGGPGVTGAGTKQNGFVKDAVPLYNVATSCDF